jgi:hypothetical protein
VSICPVCGKPIPENKSFCSDECERRQLDLKKGKESNEPSSLIRNFEHQKLLTSKGARIELQMSRGPPVRGTLMDYDPEFQKIAIMEDIGNNQKKLTFVKLNYVSALSLYGVTLKDEV